LRCKYFWVEIPLHGSWSQAWSKEKYIAKAPSFIGDWAVLRGEETPRCPSQFATIGKQKVQFQQFQHASIEAQVLIDMVIESRPQ